MDRARRRTDRLVGTGWSFPLGVDGRGGIRMARGAQDVEEAIRLILGTARGERRMRPEFGCGIHDFVFAPMDADDLRHDPLSRDRGAGALGAAHRRERRARARPIRGRRLPAHRHRLHPARHQRRAQPRLSVLHHSQARLSMSDRARPVGADATSGVPAMTLPLPSSTTARSRTSWTSASA